MAVYRAQVTHVGYWRGQVHRWNNTFHYLVGSGTPDFATMVGNLRAQLQLVGAAAYHGGIAEIKIYASTGGVPVFSLTYFDYTTPGSWLPYTGTAWGTGAVVLPTNGESAALIETAAGTSRTGKPYSLKTFWHAFQSNPTEGAGPDFTGAVQTAVTALWAGVRTVSGGTGPAFILSTPSGGPVATTSTLRPYVVSHQRTRGRRRRALVTASGKYTGPTIDVPPEVLAG